MAVNVTAICSAVKEVSPAFADSWVQLQLACIWSLSRCINSMARNLNYAAVSQIMQHIFTPSWSTIFSLNFLMGFFKTKLDNIPENTFENNPALKGWWIRWSSQYFLVIFSMVHFILCYLIVPIQHPGTTQRLYLIDSTAQTFDVLFLVDQKATLGMSSIPLCPSQPCTCSVLSCRVCRNTTQPTRKCCWDRKTSSPLFLFSPELMSMGGGI